MSHFKIHRILFLSLMIACLGLLTSCESSTSTSNNNTVIIPTDGIITREVTERDIATGEITGRQYVAGELLIYLKNIDDQAEFIKLIGIKKWSVVAYDEPLNLYTTKTNAKTENELNSYVSELQALGYVSRVKFNAVSIGPK